MPDAERTGPPVPWRVDGGAEPTAVVDVAGAEEAPPDAPLLGTTPGYYAPTRNLRKLGKWWPGEDEARMVRDMILSVRWCLCSCGRMGA